MRTYNAKKRFGGNGRIFTRASIKKKEQIRNFVLDPSGFTSPTRLNDLLRILNIIRQDVKGTEALFVMPHSLFHELSLFIENREISQKLVDVFNAWLPSYSEDHIIELIRGLSVNRDYLDSLKKFFLEYKPTTANEYVGNLDKIGEQTLYRNSLRERLGDLVGETVFEMLAVSYKLKAVMITFGERLAQLAHKAGVILVKTHSEYKNTLKQRGNIQRALRLMGYFLSLQLTTEMIDLLGLPPSLKVYKEDIGFGLIIIADG